jgi:Glycerophosphoryl diester phosphodiesterase family
MAISPRKRTYESRARVLSAVLLLARVITALCVGLLLTTAVFDTQVERVTSGTVPAESAARVRGELTGLHAPLLVVGHNVGDEPVTATDAVAFGVGAVEIDVRDIGGELAASHDPPLPFLREIAFRGPSLSRSWRIASLRPTVLLHFKDQSDGFVARVAQFLARRPPRRLVIQASSVATLASVRRRIPQAERLLLIFNRAELASVRRNAAVDSVADGLSVQESLLTPAVQQSVHGHGLRLFAWTVNDLPRLEQLIHYRLDGVMTENLDLMHLLAVDPR